MCTTNDHRHVCRYHNSFLSSFITYHRVCNKSNTMCVTSGAGFPYYYGTHQFTSSFQWGSCRSAFRCRFVFCTSVFAVFLSAIVFLLFFCRPLYFCSFSVGHCIFCLSSIYGFLLPLLSSSFSCNGSVLLSWEYDSCDQ